ncbi:MAG: hypothetical protein AAFR98_10235 [Pseudomonadota bacterium]
MSLKSFLFDTGSPTPNNHPCGSSQNACGNSKGNNPSNIHSGYLVGAVLIFNFLSATISSAQVVPFDDTDTYEVAKIANKGVCFAATKVLSENKRPMVYTYYHTVNDQRWHVLGYEINDTISTPTVTLAVDVDGETTLLRETITQNSDFMLPFENLDEISHHEALSATGAGMNVSIVETDDRVTIDLVTYRTALELMQDCLTSFSEEN